MAHGVDIGTFSLKSGSHKGIKIQQITNIKGFGERVNSMDVITLVLTRVSTYYKGPVDF